MHTWTVGSSLLGSSLHHPVPRGFTQIRPPVCVREDSGKRKVQNIVLFQPHLPALLAVSKVKSLIIKQLARNIRFEVLRFKVEFIVLPLEDGNANGHTLMLLSLLNAWLLPTRRALLLSPSPA